MSSSPEQPLKKTVCPHCRQPVAVLENRLPRVIVFWCPARDYPDGGFRSTRCEES